jgi:hypothetical protein
MKQIHLVVTFACSVLLSGFGTAIAQEQAEDHVFVATTFQATMPEGGTFAERDSLLEIYHKQVTEKNPLVLSQRVMQHSYGHNSHDMVMVSEFKNWGDIDAAGKKDNELFEKHWATQESRREYNRKLNKYFTGHSDEIYTEKTKLKK